MKLISGKTSKGGHYSPAVVSNNMVYVSGQLPIDSNGKIAEGGIAVQITTALENVERILIEAGSCKANVVMCHVYISNMEYWDEVNRIYASFFGDHKPARVVVPTRDLHHGALVEIEAIAEVKS